MLKHNIYEATTHNIRVRVEPQFLIEESTPEKDYFFWAYTVEITNLGTETVQLKTRYWNITDANGRLEEVHGEGVVGEEPMLKPGTSFSYTSGCPLKTSSGIMKGSYQMETKDEEMVDIDIPAFSLDSPFNKHLIN